MAAHLLADDVDAAPGRIVPLARSATAAVILIGLVVTVMLSLAARIAHDRTEERLLEERAREAGELLAASVPVIEEALTSAALVAATTDGDIDLLRRFLEPEVGEGGRFASVAVWSVEASGDEPLLLLGPEPALTSDDTPSIREIFDRALETPATIIVIDQLDGPSPRLGFAASGPASRYIVYAESMLPANRVSVRNRGEAFADVEYAAYLGTSVSSSALLISSTPDLPLQGRTEAITLDFGDSSIHLVMSPVSTLGSGLLEWLWLIVAGAGVAMTMAFAGLTDRLSRSRDRARALARENAELYRTQRGVAETLQHSLLPDTLPEVPGLEVRTRYEAGTEGLDIGGDWYDVIDMAGDKVLLVVGDVSGRGVEAATTMASLRYSVRAYAALDMAPPEILDRLGTVMSGAADGRFATVLCALADPAEGELVITNAGHPPLLLASEGDARYILTPVDPPVGVDTSTAYRSTTVRLTSGAVVFSFTDGLFERRDEPIDEGLERLRDAAARSSGPLDDRLQFILDTMIPAGAGDDTALLGLQWLS